MESKERCLIRTQFEWYRGLLITARLKESIFGTGFFTCPAQEVPMNEQNKTAISYKIQEIAGRIRELREITGLSVEQMAERISVQKSRSRNSRAGCNNH